MDGVTTTAGESTDAVEAVDGLMTTAGELTNAVEAVAVEAVAVEAVAVEAVAGEVVAGAPSVPPSAPAPVLLPASGPSATAAAVPSKRVPPSTMSGGAAAVLVRARADGVTGPAVVVLATAVVGLGVAVDLAVGTSLSLGTVVAVLVASVAAPAVVRFRSLATAAVLPPMLLVGAAAAIGRLSGQDHGNRELVLDVGTTLALWAPALFGATVAALLVVLVRIGHRIARR